MKIKPKDGYLVAEIEVDDTLLQEKLDLLFDFKSALLQSVSDKFMSESFRLTLSSLTNDKDIFLCDVITTTGANDSDKLVLVMDFNTINFLGKWSATMRAFDRNNCAFIHDDISSCRGDKS